MSCFCSKFGMALHWFPFMWAQCALCWLLGEFWCVCVVVVIPLQVWLPCLGETASPSFSRC